MKEKLLSKKVLSIAAIVLAALALIVGAIALALSARSDTTKATVGYLICQDCGQKGICSLDKADVAAHPEKHTLKCAKSPDCITSGYGIAVKQESGTYKFYPFDAAGSSLALNEIIYSAKLTDNLLVEVKGKMDGDVLKVESITAK